MKIRTRILCILLTTPLLVGLVCALALNRQHAAAMAGVQKEAEDVAGVLGYLLEPRKFPAPAQKIVSELREDQKRDVVLVDAGGMVLADAMPSSIGKVYHEDPNHEVLTTLRDGKIRAFTETSADYPRGIKQIVVPIQGKYGREVGAVILEYGSLYREQMGLMKAGIREVILAGFGSAVIALLLALYMGWSIAMPLQRLTGVAREFATAGRTNLPALPPRSDEIGELAAAFTVMIEKRREAEDNLRRTSDELEMRVAARTAELAKANLALQVENAERKRAQQEQIILAAELALERKHLGEILNSLPALVFEQWLPEKGNQNRNFVSSYVEKMYGFTAEEWLSTPNFWFTRVHPDDRETVAAHTSTLATAPGGHGEDTFRWIARDGRILWGETHLAVIRDEAGTPIGVRGVTLDVTARKEAEAEIAGMNKQLISVSRQAGMAEVATSVLHNVGNVLNSVNVSYSILIEQVHKSRLASVEKTADLLLSHANDLPGFFAADPRGQKLPEFLKKLAARLSGEQAAVADELRSLGRNIEHIKEIVAVQQSYANIGGVREKLPIRALIEDALRMNAAALVRHGIEVVRECEDLPSFSMEKSKVLQILVNLVSNAKYALSDTGRSGNKRLVVRASRKDGKVLVSMSDNGVGIAPENITRIFAHGFTTKKNGHGFGLHGGALAAQEMGGFLTVQSEGPGQGATFTLELPFNPKSDDANHAN